LTGKRRDQREERERGEEGGRIVGGGLGWAGLGILWSQDLKYSTREVKFQNLNISLQSMSARLSRHLDSNSLSAAAVELVVVVVRLFFYSFMLLILWIDLLFHHHKRETGTQKYQWSDDKVIRFMKWEREEMKLLTNQWFLEETLVIRIAGESFHNQCELVEMWGRTTLRNRRARGGTEKPYDCPSFHTIKMNTVCHNFIISRIVTRTNQWFGGDFRPRIWDHGPEAYWRISNTASPLRILPAIVIDWLDEESEERRKRVPERQFSDLIQRHPLRLSFVMMAVEVTGKRSHIFHCGGRIILWSWPLILIAWVNHWVDLDGNRCSVVGSFSFLGLDSLRRDENSFGFLMTWHLSIEWALGIYQGLNVVWRAWILSITSRTLKSRKALERRISQICNDKNHQSVRRRLECVLQVHQHLIIDDDVTTSQQQ
jgi:hypothetical protein